MKERVTVLSHELWARRFGSDPAVVGRVIGVLPAPFVRREPFWRDREPRPPGGGRGVGIRMPTVGYFETMRIPLLSGRLFDERDDPKRRTQWSVDLRARADVMTERPH